MASNIACKLTRNDIAASELRKNMGFDNVLRLVFGLEIMSLFKNNFLKKNIKLLGDVSKDSANTLGNSRSRFATQ